MSAPAVSLGQHPPARHTLIHLSDTHLTAEGRLGERIAPGAALERALAAVERTGARPDAIVVTGDLTDTGEPDAYRMLRAAIDPVADAVGAPVVWVAGNHDERPAMRSGLFGAEPTLEPLTTVVDLGGLRLIALDTSVPGWHHGELGAAQLGWLAVQLAHPAPHGTVLAMHHPPLPSHVPLFDILELRDQPALADVIAGSDVRAILAGHLHYATSGTFAGVPVHVAAATCYTMDLASPAADVNGMDAGQSFGLVHVYDDVLTHATVPVVDETGVGRFSQEWVDEMAALSVEERLERFSRKRPE